MENKLIQLFDNEKYKEVINLTSPYKKENILDFEILYYLKSILALNNFEIESKKEIKKLLFYYFYLV
jgi:hypothetical protein